MNSERIRERFGSFGLDILESSASRRVSSLYSLEDGRKVCRTYAVVEFGDAILPELAAEHALVMAGESIGAVFKGRGWTITKRHTRVGGTALGSADAGIGALMRLGVPQQVALHSYVFEVAKGDAAYEYATITEMHHPDYLTEADVLSIYGPPEGGEESRRVRAS